MILFKCTKILTADAVFEVLEAYAPLRLNGAIIIEPSAPVLER